MSKKPDKENNTTPDTDVEIKDTVISGDKDISDNKDTDISKDKDTYISDNKDKEDISEKSEGKDTDTSEGKDKNISKKKDTDTSKKRKAPAEEKPGESDDDLYTDEVYKDLDTSDDDMVFLDISGNEVKAAPSIDQEAEDNTKKLTINVNPEAVCAWLLVLFCSAVYISLTFNNNVWMDEAFTASLIKTDLPGVISRSMADTLPPLYNIILKLSTDLFGYTVTVMKITSTIPMILTLILGATVVRKRFTAAVSYIFMLAVTLMPNMLFFGVEIRMYSLGFLFATASAIFAFELVSKPCRKNWIIFILVSVLAGYSHHFAFITTGFIYLYLLIHACAEQKKFSNERDRTLHPILFTSFLKCLCVTFILYLPCLLITLKQFKSVSGYFSMPEVTLPVFIKYCRYPFTVGFTPFSIALLALTLVLLIRLIFHMAGVGKAEQNKTQNVFSFWCFIIFYLVLMFGTIVSKLMTANIFVDRYLFFSTGLIWLFFAIEAGSLKKPLVYCIIMFLLVIGVYSYTQAYSSEYAQGADETIKWLESNVSEGDSLYTLEDYEELALCLPFYDSDLTNYESLSEAVNASGGKNVWVALMNGYDEETTESLPKGNLGYNAYIDEMDEAGYSLEFVNIFRFDRYIFKMYKLKRSSGYNAQKPSAIFV